MIIGLRITCILHLAFVKKKHTFILSFRAIPINNEAYFYI